MSFCCLAASAQSVPLEKSTRGEIEFEIDRICLVMHQTNTILGERPCTASDKAMLIATSFVRPLLPNPHDIIEVLVELVAKFYHGLPLLSPVLRAYMQTFHS